MQILQQQTEAEIRQFARFAEQRIVAEQAEAVRAAQEHAEQLAMAGLGEPPVGVMVTFARLPREALTDLVGFLQDGSPLRDLLDELGPEASASIRKALIAGVATGQNPRVIAQQMKQALGGNLVRALTIARTEVLRAYRESSRRTYQANSDVIKGWIWHSALGTRTCPACWAMHGTFHRLDERLDDHVNGRCSAIPVTKTWKELGFKDVPETQVQVGKGTDLFEKLSDADKEKILGKAGFQAYKVGAVKLEDFVGRKVSREWGTMRYTRSLRDILGEREAKKWKGLVLADKQAPKSVNAVASSCHLRMQQVSAMSGEEIDKLLARIRQSRTIPKLSYHFEQHGPEFGARDEQEYLRKMQEHLSRGDLRIFTYLRGRRQVPFWELIDLETGATVLYNESQQRVWSFYRMALPEYRLRRYQLEWLEAVRTARGWEFKESWDL